MLLLLPFLSFLLPLCAKLAAVAAKLWHFLQVLYFDPGGRIVLHLDCEHCFSEGVEVLSSSLDIITNCVQCTRPNSCRRDANSDVTARLLRAQA